MAGEEKQNKAKQTHMPLKQLQNNYVLSARLQCGPQVVCIRIEWILRKCKFLGPATCIQRVRAGTGNLHMKAISSMV